MLYKAFYACTIDKPPMEVHDYYVFSLSRPEEVHYPACSLIPIEVRQQRARPGINNEIVVVKHTVLRMSFFLRRSSVQADWQK